MTTKHDWPSPWRRLTYRTTCRETALWLTNLLLWHNQSYRQFLYHRPGTPWLLHSSLLQTRHNLLLLRLISLLSPHFTRSPNKNLLSSRNIDSFDYNPKLRTPETALQHTKIPIKQTYPIAIPLWWHPPSVSPKLHLLNCLKQDRHQTFLRYKIHNRLC